MNRGKNEKDWNRWGCTHTLTYLLRIKEQIKTNSISVGLYIYAYRIGLFAWKKQ